MLHKILFLLCLKIILSGNFKYFLWNPSIDILAYLFSPNNIKINFSVAIAFKMTNSEYEDLNGDFTIKLHSIRLSLFLYVKINFMGIVF